MGTWAKIPDTFSQEIIYKYNETVEQYSFLDKNILAAFKLAQRYQQLAPLLYADLKSTTQLRSY